jgi:hypothetical protein
MQRVSIERHRPERGNRDVAVAPAGQCCCCCCCCLHSVGGIIGAATARSRPLQDPELPAAGIDGATREPKNSVAPLYWTLVLVLCGIAVGWNVGIERHPRTDESILIIALALPAVQLAAAATAAMILAFSRRPGKEERVRHLGRIAVRGFVGALIGAAVMVPLLAMCK